MIVPMKSVTLLCLLPDQERSLAALHDLGVLHLTPVVTPDSEDLGQVRSRLAAARETADALAGPVTAGSAASSGADVEAVVQKVQELLRRRKELQGGLENLERERLAVAPYGDFDPAAVRRLEAAEVLVKLVQVPSKEPLPVIDGAVVQVLSDDKSFKYLAIISRTPVEFGGREFPLPARALKAVEAELAASRRAMDEADRLLVGFRGQRAGVEERIRSLEDREHFLMARDGMGTWERVSYLKGYCPIPNVEALQAQGRAQGWGLLIEDPGPDDPAPTLLHNPRWVQPIKAIFKMIGIVPGYREFDISGVFLLFYSLFFAMLVGDAGYGLLFLALTGAIRLFARKAPPELPRLLGTLSVCTIVWGVLTGSYFGIRFESLPPLLRQGRVAWLTDEVHLMALCFLIGSIHLTIAHVWNAWRVRNSLAALAQIGWVAITWSMYYLAMNMILGRPLPAFVLPLFMGGLAGVVVFMTPLRMLKTDWPNHAMLPLSIIGSFGDVVSYVRLFAVGSAGTAISVAFNEMALSGGISSFGAGVGAALILFLAHAMNILLSALGVIVHGVRLNTLEFSGHLGMQWTGIPFKPFRKQEPGQE
jgi:V/A-type H+-transporting ATPase subunit I